MVAEMAPLRAGDRVELVSVPPGRHNLHAGMQGVVLVGSADGPWGLCAVQFGPPSARPWQLHPRHLRRLDGPAGDAA
jgi:hypothetical protein